MEKWLQKMKEHTSETRLTSEILIQTLFVPWSRAGKAPVRAAVTALSSAETSGICLVWSQNHQPCHLVENSSLKCVFISLRYVGCVSPSSPIDFNTADATVQPQTEMQWHNDLSFFLRFPGGSESLLIGRLLHKTNHFEKNAACRVCVCQALLHTERFWVVLLTGPLPVLWWVLHGFSDAAVVVHVSSSGN